LRHIKGVLNKADTLLKAATSASWNGVRPDFGNESLCVLLIVEIKTATHPDALKLGMPADEFGVQ
jgi:hypothetical protein